MVIWSNHDFRKHAFAVHDPSVTSQPCKGPSNDPLKSHSMGRNRETIEENVYFYLVQNSLSNIAITEVLKICRNHPRPKFIIFRLETLKQVGLRQSGQWDFTVKI